MAILYLDTSALVKLYVREAGTDFMLTQAHPDAGHRLAILSLARVEMRAAVRRRARQGDLTSDAAQQMLDALSQHVADVFTVQPVNDTVIEQASGAIDRHGLRAYDALQLAGLLVMRDSLGDSSEYRFLCADAQLLAAASSEGLTAINPAEHA